MAPNRDIRETIVQLLSNMSDGKEIRTYLQRFSSLDQSRFAVIKIGGAILRDRLEETAASLAFLHTVGLTPIVLHGGGPQLNEDLNTAGITTEKLDGLRVTPPDVLDVARETFTSRNIELVEAVRGQGVSAHGLTQGAFDARLVDADKYGFVGEPTKVHLDLIRSIVESGAIPILTCLGVAPGGQLVNMNADAATRELVHAVQPMKIIFLTDAGGLRNAEDHVIDSINLASDYDTLMKEEWVHSGMQFKLAEIKQLLDDSPVETSVSITTPSALVRELFTHGGAGTLIRKGERIVKGTEKPQLNSDELEKLINAAFGKDLLPDWWERLDLEAAYVSDSGRAAAIVTKPGDFFYLDKFAIDDSARGEGLARTVWDLMIGDYPSLFWRSRRDNRFNAFYIREADGFVNQGGWTIFWKGEPDFDRIAPAVKLITDLAPDFDE
jgi:acetylglutamate kinase